VDSREDTCVRKVSASYIELPRTLFLGGHRNPDTASCLLQHFGRFGTPSAIHTDRGTAFHNELVEKLTRLAGADHSLSTAYSKEENGIVECANQEVLRHLTAILFDTRVSNAWSYEQLPMVQRIMNTVEKTSSKFWTIVATERKGRPCSFSYAGRVLAFSEM